MIIYTIATSKQKSPTLLINIALIAALFAWTLVLQKLINKKEHKPTPSHPKNNIIKLDETTRIHIKKVNNDKNDINFEEFISLYM